MRHFLDIQDVSQADLRKMIDSATLWKRARAGMPRGAVDHNAPLAGCRLAMIFEAPSTRTRVSFEVAMHQLGGAVTILEGDKMQLGRGETIEDTARVLSRYVDAIMIRSTNHAGVAALADAASVPVINALTDRSHPCQIMADVMTYEEKRGPIAGRRFAWVGDGNNVATSLIEAAARFDFKLVLGCPDDLAPNAEAVAWARSQGADIVVTNDAEDAVAGVDAVFADTWVSMGDKDAAARHNMLAPYRVDTDLMAGARPDALFFHCLPAHRGEEVTAEVIDGPQSVVFDEAENRLHAQKAVLAWCLEAL